AAEAHVRALGDRGEVFGGIAERQARVRPGPAAPRRTAARPGRGAGDAAVLFTHRGANLVLRLFVHLRSLLFIKTGTLPKGRSSPEPHDHADGGRWAERGELGGSLQRSGCALASDAFEPKVPEELRRRRREQVHTAQPPCSRSP